MQTKTFLRGLLEALPDKSVQPSGVGVVTLHQASSPPGPLREGKNSLYCVVFARCRSIVMEEASVIVNVGEHFPVKMHVQAVTEEINLIVLVAPEDRCQKVHESIQPDTSVVHVELN